MLLQSRWPAVPAPPNRTELDALRAELRCILQHPAIAPARRQAAEAFISRCTETARLGQWLALAVTECVRWEEHMLAHETALRGGSYFR
ncbi:hypothetical protein H8B13_19660 [Hymenobacter sp. BT188]|uniref:hypothetical protein n=1 Tax=Hymenobacter sp. BT188 TaxID=2763504 RepID=UPI0016517EE9|nr:hypothetical protein [Hymenobacter sp. BT188]MBC6609045.1 hypothetical protein [Hymenobacter sp. BT188]